MDFEVARKRLVRRHVKAGIAADETQADVRARENDLVNVQLQHREQTGQLKEQLLSSQGPPRKGKKR